MSDPAAVKQEAREAKDIVDSKIFQKAMLDFRKQLFSDLLAARTREMEERFLGMLRCLDEFPLILNSYINNAKMLEKR